MLNITVIQGRLTATPELTQTSGGIDCCRFTVANDSGWGDKKKTNFISCTAWRKTAEFIAQHFNKGDMILVHGELSQNKYTTRDGDKREFIEITVNGADFCGRERREEESQTALPVDPSTAPKFEDINPDDDDLPF